MMVRRHVRFREFRQAGGNIRIREIEIQNKSQKRKKGRKEGRTIK
jgi:hypothetical protein